MKLTFRKALLIVVLLFASPCFGATLYYASSGVGNDHLTAGSDATDCLTTSTPCLTIGGALAKAFAEHGTNGADVRIILMGGIYDTSKGLKRGASNQFTALLSGSSDAHPFTIQGYKPSDPTGATGCDSDPVHPVAGLSSCLSTVITRYSATGTKTEAEMQSTNGSACGGRDCVGMPDDADCLFAYNTTDFHSCWSGAPNVPVYIFQDRSSGNTVLEAVVEVYGIQDDVPENKPKYVVFDGISCDARGVVSACYRNGQHNDHDLMITHITWKNGYWINTNQSAMSQPGVSNGIDYRYAGPDGIDGAHPNGGVSYEFLLDCTGSPCVKGERTSNHFLMKNFKISKAGSPFNTLRVDGTHCPPTCTGSSPNRRDIEQAAFLHAFYLHTGGNTCDNCEISETAGFCFAPDGDDNHFINSYCHDSDGGVQAYGVYQTVENSVFYNVGNTSIQSPAVGGGGTRDDTNRTTFRNNTFISGPRSVYSNAIQLGHGSHANMIQNNIFQGFARGIEGSPGGCDFGSCSYTDRVVIQNNVFDNVTTPVSINGTDGSNVMLPACTLGGGAGTMSSCNKFNPAGGIKFASINQPNFTLLSDSPAVDYGATNSLAKDYLGNTRPYPPAGAIDAGAFEYCTGGACSAAPTTANITVNTDTPGVSIAWTGGTACTKTSPQTTQFTMTCGLGSTLTFTAPPTNFTNWAGCTTQVSNVCNVTLNNGTSVTANYGSVRTLTLMTAFPSTGVTINIRQPGADPGSSPPLPDLDGKTSCTIYPCTLRYNAGQIVLIDAPDKEPGGTYFSTWTNCSHSGDANVDTQPNFSDCHQLMNSDVTVTATFNGSGCSLKKLDLVPGDIITICPGQEINLYSFWDVTGIQVGTATSGSIGTVTDGPFDFDADSNYVRIDFVVNNVPPPCADVTVNCHPDGWLSTYNIQRSGSGGPPQTKPVQVGVGKYGAGVTIK